MARRRLPARPLLGYRDVGGEVRHGRRQIVRAWVILAVLVVGFAVVLIAGHLIHGQIY